MPEYTTTEAAELLKTNRRNVQNYAKRRTAILDTPATTKTAGMVNRDTRASYQELNATRSLGVEDIEPGTAIIIRIPQPKTARDRLLNGKRGIALPWVGGTRTSRPVQLEGGAVVMVAVGAVERDD